MALWQWSTTAANNATADPSINWAEGQAPSTVNDSARAMMAAIATWFQAPEWINRGDVPTYTSATTFTVPTNRTAVYTVGRRVRATVTAGTVYGTISASAFASVTTVTLSMDGTEALDSGLSEVDVGILNPAFQSLPSIGSGLSFSNQASPNVAPITFGDGTGWYLRFQTTGGTTVATLKDTGDFTASGNITANSDERIKGEWEAIPSDFLERLALVKNGTYRRTDMGGDARHAGVGAQSLRAVLPEAVLEGASGMLSVAYGNAALVACVELAKEVVRLRALMESK